MSIIFNTVPVPEHLVNEHYEDRYFDMIDAIEEAKHIYFKGNNIIERLVEKPNEALIIGETGFGAGRIIISLMDYLDKSELKDINIIYNTVELHPISAEKMSLILDGFKDRVGVGSLIDQLVNEYSKLDINKSGWQQLKLIRPFGTINLNLWIGEALEMVEALTEPCDVWFLDGHSPKKNPEIWREELIKEVGQKTKVGGTCATFTVSGFVTRNIKAAGFTVEQCPSYAKKRAVLRGIKLPIIE